MLIIVKMTKIVMMMIIEVVIMIIVKILMIIKIIKTDKIVKIIMMKKPYPEALSSGRSRWARSSDRPLCSALDSANMIIIIMIIMMIIMMIMMVIIIMIMMIMMSEWVSNITLLIFFPENIVEIFFLSGLIWKCPPLGRSCCLTFFERNLFLNLLHISDGSKVGNLIQGERDALKFLWHRHHPLNS